MRGVPPGLVVSAAVAAWPLGYVVFEKYVRGAALSLSAPMLALVLLLPALPWLQRLIGRLSYRAAIDDLALHFGGEALPWNKITRAFEQRSWRRDTLVIERGATASVRLVVRDLFAGRLEPLAELEQRLVAHGHPIERR